MKLSREWELYLIDIGLHTILKERIESRVKRKYTKRKYTKRADSKVAKKMTKVWAAKKKGK